jgi:hypothetical protein
MWLSAQIHCHLAATHRYVKFPENVDWLHQGAPAAQSVGLLSLGVSFSIPVLLHRRGDSMTVFFGQFFLDMAILPCLTLWDAWTVPQPVLARP